MTAPTHEDDNPAGVLGEVRKQRRRVRLRIGSAWFELTFIGLALLAALVLSSLVSTTLAKAAVYAACLLPYYAAVIVRGRKTHRDFGLRLAPSGHMVRDMSIAGGTAASALVAGVVFHGDIQIVAITTIGAACCCTFGSLYRLKYLFALAIVEVVGGTLSLVTHDADTVWNLTVSAGLAGIGLWLLVQVVRRRG